MRNAAETVLAVLVCAFIVVIGGHMMFKLFDAIDADNQKRYLLQSQCIVEQGKDPAWCWHWANVQMGVR